MQLQSGLNPDAALLVLIGDAVRENALDEVLTPDSQQILSAAARRLLPNLKAGQLEVVRLGQRDVALAPFPPVWPKPEISEWRRLGQPRSSRHAR